MASASPTPKGIPVPPAPPSVHLATSIFRMVLQNLRRNLKLFALSGLGIVIGIAAFVFFLGLSGGVRKVVLGDIFPINRIEVIAPKTTLTGLAAPVDDALTEKIRAPPGVHGAFPRMPLSFPAEGRGTIFGAQLYFPLGGFCDGIDPELMGDDPAAAGFRDWDADEAGKLQPCAPDGTCADEVRYCAADKLCHHRVPVIVSRHVIELYNGSFAASHGLRRIGMAEEAVLSNMKKALKFRIDLGKSAVKTLILGTLGAPPEQHEGILVGISNKAVPIGITVPIGYIKRWNEKFTGAFHSITSKEASKPTALRFCWMYSFIGSGSIWPEPEVEIAILILGFLVGPYPASASSLSLILRAPAKAISVSDRKPAASTRRIIKEIC